MDWRTNCTCPSQNTKFTPPVCWLLNGVSFSLSASSGMVLLIGNRVFRMSRP